MSNAAEIITAKILERPDDLAGVPPVVIREAVRRACALARDLISDVLEGYEGALLEHDGQFPEPSAGIILEDDISRCLVCRARVVSADTHQLGWRRDEEGESFCGPCYANLEEDEGDEEEAKVTVWTCLACYGPINEDGYHQPPSKKPTPKKRKPKSTVDE